MKKLFAFIVFEYHYLAYQIPMKRMREALKDAHSINDAKGSDAEFREAALRFTKWAKIVAHHQKKCIDARIILSAK